MYHVAYLSDRGLKKENNEDALLVDKKLGLFVIADGMGGHERGEVASHIVVETFKELLSSDADSTITYSSGEVDEDETIPYFVEEDDDATLAYSDFEMHSSTENRLNAVIERSTQKIKSYVEDKKLSGQIGTTVVGLYRLEESEEVVVFHLGDSRLYRVRDNKIEKMTDDHSKYEQMKQSGRYSKEQLAKVNRNSITKAVGNFKVMPLTLKYLDLRKKDLFFLCSDGVSDLLHASELLEMLLDSQKSLEDITENIKNCVYTRGAKDNLSMIILEYLG